jgi:hypothetical protein
LFPDKSVDLSNKNPSRYTRLPGFPRENGKEPQLLAINLGPADFTIWEKQQPAGQAGLETACVSGAAFLDLVIPPKEIIVEDWLKEGEVGYLYAFRGVGKTWMVLEFAVSIALGRDFGPWKVLKPCPVLYVDGEMAYQDIRERILSLVGEVPENLSILNHEVLFHATGRTMNFAEPAQQQELLRLAVAQGIKVHLFDNISCLFTGVDEDKSREWERVKPWLLDMRRHRISPVLVHHTGYDLTHMRGTSSREDAASWVMRLDSKKDDFETLGANFISRFTKYRGKWHLFDYEWTFGPDSTDSDKVKVLLSPISLAMSAQLVSPSLTHWRKTSARFAILGKRPLRAQEQELPAVGQPAVGNHLANVLPAMLLRLIFLAVGENHRQD